MATNPNIVSSIKLKRDDADRSLKWYRKEIQKLAAGRQKTQIRNDVRKEAYVTPSIEIGKMYLYKYDPKFKEVLPVYDTYPLVFPFNRASGGFLGINLHYLPFGFRHYIIQMLEPLTIRSSNLERSKKAKISWQILTKIAGVGGLDNAVKHYLFSHVKSSFMEIHHTDWITVANLPLENFIRK